MCLNFSTEMTAITRERNEKYYYTINLKRVITTYMRYILKKVVLRKMKIPISLHNTIIVF